MHVSMAAARRCDQIAAYFAEQRQMHDFRTLQDHAAPKTTSDLLFKGAVAGRARSVYSGLIRVRKEAPGTTAFQTNRNLKLGEGAWADSVPNLEIDTNDVRCSHASAVGPVDAEQRFYLESRGVPPDRRRGAHRERASSARCSSGCPCRGMIAPSARPRSPPSSSRRDLV